VLRNLKNLDYNQTIDNKILEALQEAAKDGRITCAEAHALVERLECSYEEVAKAINQLQLKIKHCQLGCF
jgi:hypothetical protein